MKRLCGRVSIYGGDHFENVEDWQLTSMCWNGLGHHWQNSCFINVVYEIGSEEGVQLKTYTYGMFDKDKESLSSHSVVQLVLNILFRSSMIPNRQQCCWNQFSVQNYRLSHQRKESRERMGASQFSTLKSMLCVTTKYEVFEFASHEIQTFGCGRYHKFGWWRFQQNI